MKSLFAIVVTILITGVIFYSCNSQKVAEREYQRIASTHQVLDKRLKDAIREAKADTTSNGVQIDESTLHQLDYNQRLIGEMLEVQFERQQAERNVIEIWAATLTIVFLIFSFYSLFHTDNLVRTAQASVDRISKLSVEVEKEKANIEGKLSGILSPYKDTAKEIDIKMEALKNSLGRLDDVPGKLQMIVENSSKISDLEGKINDTNKKLLTIQNQIDDWKVNGNDDSEDSEDVEDRRA